MTRITKQPDERRREILDTARKLFVQNGYDKIAISDIANELNIAPGLIYHYYKSKLSLLYDVVEQVGEEETSASMQFIDNFAGTARECLDFIFSNDMKKHEYDKLAHSIADDELIMEYIQEKMTRSFTPVMTHLIERGNEDGSWDCEYPEETTLFIMQGLTGIIHIDKSIEDTTVAENVVRNIVLRLLGAKS